MEWTYPQVIHRATSVKMGTWGIFASLLLMVVAFCASAYAVSVARRCFVTLAALSSRLSTVEKSERLTPSKLAELSEFREAISRCEELLTKVNRREIARAKARSDDGTFTVNNAASIKDQLRVRAGLRAGTHPNHP